MSKKKQNKSTRKFAWKSSLIVSWFKIRYMALTGVFFKPSGDCIVAPYFCFFKLETSNFGYVIIIFLFNCAKFQKDWTTFILDILQGSLLWILVDYKNKKHQRGDPYKMSNIKFVQSYSNFAQFIKMKKKARSQNLKALTQ